MKPKYNLLFNCGILLCCMFTLNTCKDECVPEKIYIKDLYKYVPYTGNDTLRFLHNNTDTQTFVGQGMERFYVANKRSQDEPCYQNHESVRIRFKNIDKDVFLIMEYSQLRVGAKFFYDGNQEAHQVGNGQVSVNIGGHLYNYVTFFSSDNITTSYLAYTISNNNTYRGILKVKYPNDSLEIIP